MENLVQKWFDENGDKLLQPMPLAICLKCGESTWGSLKMSLILAIKYDHEIIPKIKSLEDSAKTE